MTGGFSGSVDFIPQLSDTLQRTSNGQVDAYCLKITSQGNVIDIMTIGGTLGDVAHTMVLANNNLIIGGTFNNSVDFDPSANTSILTSSGAFECFLLSVDTAFNFNWAKSFGGWTNDFLYNSVLDNSGKYIYNIGSISDSIDADPSPSNTFMLRPADAAIYVQKVDTAGNFIWAKMLDGANLLRTFGIDVSDDGKVTLAARFSTITGSIDVDPDPNTTYNLISAGGQDGLVVQLDSSGTFIAAAQFGGVDDDEMRAVHSKPNGTILVGGSFQNTIDINPAANVNLVTSNGQRDMLFLELGLCKNTEDTISIVACEQFVIPGDTNIITSSGFYSTNYFDMDGCDSSVVFDVTIQSVTTSVTQTIDGLKANTTAVNPTFQWLECGNGQIVQGATNQTFMPSANGQYAVIVSDSICIDTSACISINNVGLDEDELLRNLIIYPNPTTGLLNIRSESTIQSIEVLDLMGRTVLIQKNEKERVDVSGLSQGVYLVKVYTEYGEVVRRVVKE